MESNSNRRSWKNMLINKQIQIGIMVINLISMVAVVAFNTAIMLSSSLCNIYYTEDSSWLKAIDMYALSSEILIFSMAAVFILAVFSQMIISHKICGPLVNFTNSFKSLATGDLTRHVHLRKHDLLKGEAGQFNDMLTQLSVHIEVIKNDNRFLLQTLREFAQAGRRPGRHRSRPAGAAGSGKRDHRKSKPPATDSGGRT